MDEPLLICEDCKALTPVSSFDHNWRSITDYIYRWDPTSERLVYHYKEDDPYEPIGWSCPNCGALQQYENAETLDTLSRGR